MDVVGWRVSDIAKSWCKSPGFSTFTYTSRFQIMNPPHIRLPFPDYLRFGLLYTCLLESWRFMSSFNCQDVARRAAYLKQSSALHSRPCRLSTYLYASFSSPAVKS